jgi:hypothetical protein
MRAGTKALGLDVKWRFHFLGPGSVVAPTRDAVYLDVGGALCPGVIDQHQDGTLGRSTAELVVRHPELVYRHLMDGWLDRRDAGQDLRGVAFSPALVTHADPDFDAMVACWLVRRLIEDGDLPPEAEALAGYSALVDQGEYQVDIARPETATQAIHVAYLGLQNLKQGFAATIARGHELLDLTFGAIREARTHLYGLTVADLFPPALRPPCLVSDKGTTPDVPRKVAFAASSWREDERFSDVVGLLETDLVKFRRDLQAGTTTSVDLPAADGGDPITVPAFMASRPTESVLNKYWVRASKLPYFVCPYGADKGGVFPRVILSLDPTWKDPSGRRPTLRGLGFRLEQAEANGRSGNADLDRGMPARWADGTCDNADPWYDGRGHDFAIIDSPRAGTVLAYADIRALAASAFWQVRLDEAEVAVAIPLHLPGDPAALATVKPMALPDQFADGLSSYFQDSTEMPAPGTLPTVRPPAGMSLGPDVVRSFPAQTAPPIRLLKIRLLTPRSATLEALVAWLGELSAQHHGRIYTVAHVRFEPGVQAIADPDRLLTRLCAASGTLREEDRDVVLYNGRAIALSERGAAGKRAGLLLELMLYAAFQAESLQRYTAKIVDVLASKDMKDGERVRREFLNFHAKYVHHDVVFDGDAREVYAGLRDALGLPVQHAKAIGDLDRLAQIEEDGVAFDAAWKTGLLGFLIGLTGIVEAGPVFFDSEVSVGLKVGLATTLACATVVWFCVNPRRKSGTS